ncbi:hypothetical protein RB195_020438 [Necator americanus]|uniref:RecF/RecN/SMC N-terminal domain-containing protein n=1 Tax=Necator americanus TaxID=51031 RepID=A0ABR1CMF4_NECAM
MDGDMEVDADVENHHFRNIGHKRQQKNGEINSAVKVRRIDNHSTAGISGSKRAYVEVAGRIAGVELENFMCHGHLKVDFNTSDNNCFYIGGPNGSGKSALFASLNIGLGGRGNNNDRGSSVKGYIKEGRNKAKIRLILTNTGLGSHPDYGEFVVVERTITPSASTYALKSIKGFGRNRHEILVSKKKADLDQLLVRYGIQLNNPIFWMSQDRSRHFLHQMKPDRLYQIFMCATELEHTKACYEQCELIVSSIESMCQSMKGEFERQKRKYQAMMEERRRMRGIQDMRNQQSAIGWMLLWCPLRDVLEKIQVLEKKREKFAEESEHLQQRIEGTIAKKQECIAEACTARQKIDEECIALNELKSKIRFKEERMRDLQGELSAQDSKRYSMEKSKSSLEQRKQRIIDQIGHFEEESQCEKRKEEAAITRAKMEKITTKESELVERLQVVEQERNDLQRIHEEFMSNQNEAVRESRKVSAQIRELQHELHRAEITAKNAVMRFGENVPKILEVVNANSDKFEHVPRGPIGMYMKLRDRKWTFAVEEATRRLLTSFVFHSKRDHQVFERLMKANRVPGALPNAIFTKFTTPPHDVKANEPSSDWNTILRVVEITDDVVRNVLIDMASVEGTVLLESDQDARRIMDGNCPDKCIRAYTPTGGMAMGRNRRGEGFYRFYACRGPPRATILSGQDTVADVSVMELELEKLRDKFSEMQKHIKKVTDETAKAQRELGKALQNYSTLETDLDRLRSQYRSLERRLEQLEMDDDTSVVDNMRRSLDELIAQIADLEKQFEKLDESASQKKSEIRQVKEELSKIKADFVEAKKKITDLENEEESVRERIRHIDATIDSDRRRHERIRESLTKMEESNRELQDEKMAAEERAKRSEELPTPSSMTNPPDMEQLGDTAELDEQYKTLTMKIESAEKVIGNIVTAEQLQEFKDSYERMKKHYLLLKGLNKKLSECIRIRNEKFPIMCHAITMRLKMTFQRLMATRSYHGTLVVDRQKQVININVATHQKDDSSDSAAKSVVQDLRGLSGGERSFTTACFIMALWEIMEAPFRCMDEFDVFMDMINRRVIMNLLVKLATEQYSHNQFIFFTPQGIKELGESEHVQVFEMPKVRE